MTVDKALRRRPPPRPEIGAVGVHGRRPGNPSKARAATLSQPNRIKDTAQVPRVSAAANSLALSCDSGLAVATVERGLRESEGASRWALPKMAAIAL